MAKSIYKTYDEYGTIDVLDDGNKRYLTFGNQDEQSLQIKATPHIPQHEYGRAIMLSLLFCDPKSVCVMGLGGGTLTQAYIHALLKTMPSELRYAEDFHISRCFLKACVQFVFSSGFHALS